MHCFEPHRWLCWLVLLTAVVNAQQAPAAAGNPATPLVQKLNREGVAIELSLTPDGQAAGPREGAEARLQFKVTDAASGTPLTGLRPSAWLDMRRGTAAGQAPACQQKIQAFLQGKLSARPDIDLNNYYLLTLNREGNISVLDPLLGFGGSRLAALVQLKSPGADWALTRDQQRLFVALPLVNQIAVVYTATWKVAAELDAGAKPVRLALQPDERYLWVINDAAPQADAVTVIDTVTLKTVKRLALGAGPHEIVFSDDDRTAFVTNQQSGTLTLFDIPTLTAAAEIKTGAQPVALAFSALSQAVYIADAASGDITVVDSRRRIRLNSISTKPGLRVLRFTRDGRYGFVLNTTGNALYVFDAARNRALHSVEIKGQPDGLAFTADFAYVHAAQTADVALIRLAEIGQAEALPVTIFPGGQSARLTENPSGLFFPAPEGGSMLFANPGDRMIYYYSEGMAAPMGSFQNYRREPRAVLVVDNSLRESAPGVYARTFRLPASGSYDLALLLDAPRLAHCFALDIQPDPALSNKPAALALQITPQLDERVLRVGEELRLRFQLTDAATKQPRTDLPDVQVMWLLAPGVWHKRAMAQPLGKGLYEVTLTAPEAGVYHVYVACPSLKVGFNQSRPLILQALQQTGERKTKDSEKLNGGHQ